MTSLDVADLVVISGRVLGITTAAIVVQSLALGRIEPDDMAGWLAARLSASASRRIRMPHAGNKERVVRAPRHGRARRARSGAGMSIDGRMLVWFSDHAAAAVFMAPPTSALRISCSPSTTTTGQLRGRWSGSGLPRTGSATPSPRYGRKSQKGVCAVLAQPVYDE